MPGKAQLPVRLVTPGARLFILQGRGTTNSSIENTLCYQNNNKECSAASSNPAVYSIHGSQNLVYTKSTALRWIMFLLIFPFKIAVFCCYVFIRENVSYEARYTWRNDILCMPETIGVHMEKNSAANGILGRKIIKKNAGVRGSSVWERRGVRQRGGSYSLYRKTLWSWVWC